MRESQIEQYLVDRVKALGGEVRKVKWIGRRGAPDRLVMLPEVNVGDVRNERLGDLEWQWKSVCERKPQTIWIELKAPGEKAKPHQVREHERMRKMGQRVEVIDSIEGVDEVLS